MKNKDMPAMPLALDVRVDEHGNQFCDDAYPGLTKREHFAAMAMQGILAGSTSEDVGYDDWAEIVACHSVAAADALLAELDKE